MTDNPTHTPLPWRCFHCDEEFTDRREAALHFGADEGKTPACQIKGSEHGLLRALRDAEAEADEAVQRMHDESTDAAKAYHRQRCRHTQALVAAEEVGYSRGLQDGLAVNSHHDLIEALRAAREALRAFHDGLLSRSETIAKIDAILTKAEAGHG